MPSLDAALEDRGLTEYKTVLLENGLSTLADLRGVTDQDLKEIGVEKLFHRRRLLQIAEEEESKARAQQHPSSAVATEGQGDHIRVEVLGARGGEAPLTERDYYVKVCLCDKIDHDIYPIENTVQKTVRARGPQPVWPLTDKTALKVKSSFRSHSLALELKEHRVFGENKLVGVLVLPMSRFHGFTAGQVEDTWHLLRAECDDNSEVTASLHLRLSVPGGCPKSLGPAYHVTSVVMQQRKLRVTIFEASLQNQVRDEPGSPHARDRDQQPSLYATLHLTDKSGETNIKAKTKVVPHSSTPQFDENFEFTAEVGKCKLLTVKLKRENGTMITTHETVGVVRIPIQYYLAQRRPADVDNVFPALDEDNRPRGRVHLRLQVLSIDAPSEEIAVGRFRRTDSVPSQHSDVDVDTHPAFSPTKTRRRGSTFESLEPNYVSDTETEDEKAERQMSEAAARRNQRAAKRDFADDNDLI